MAAGVPLFDRGIRLTVVAPAFGGPLPPIVVNPIPPVPGGVAPPQIAIRFTVRKTLSSEPDRASVSLWNLQKTTRDVIAGAARRVIDWIPGGVPTPLISIDGRILPGDPIVVDTVAGVAHMRLEAGYGGALAAIFDGAAAPVINRRSGPDWITTLQGGDAELPLTQAVGNMAFPPGTTAMAVLTYLATTMGLSIAPTAALAQISAYVLTGGAVVQGRARDAVAEIMAALQLSWWVDSGLLWALAPGEVLPGPPVFCSPEAVPGFVRLLEAPMRIDDNGVAIRCQFHAPMRPGYACVIASSELAGSYRIEEVEHSGDNRAGQFVTEAIVRVQDPLGLPA